MADGSLSHQEDIWTRGDYPRTLTLDNQGQWLYVMNQRSDNIPVLAWRRRRQADLCPGLHPVAADGDIRSTLSRKMKELTCDFPTNV
jgi:hypothetical protein